MQKFWPRLALTGLLIASPMSLTAPLAQTPHPLQARVIVKFKADADPGAGRQQMLSLPRSSERAARLAQRVGLNLKGGSTISERMQVVLANGISSSDLAHRLARESDVEYAVPDQRRYRNAAPNDPLYAAGSSGHTNGQWYLHAPVGQVQSSIDVEAAWDISTGSTSVVVAVLDTGIRYDHADLLTVGSGGNFLAGYDMIANVAVANDGDGRDADASDPGDWLESSDLSQSEFADCVDLVGDSSWHGTQTAGLIGAITNNGVGMASVGRGVRVMPIRVLGKCGGYDSDIIAGMRWAAGLTVSGVSAVNSTPAKVLSLSLGSAGTCPQSYIDAVGEITAAGAVVIASAGNSAGEAVTVPANCQGVISVAGLRHIGTKSGFSNLGSEVAISAPAGNCVNETGACLYPILTTTNVGTQAPVASSSIYSDDLSPSVGTSFSAPLVAGTAALVLSAEPLLTPAQVLGILQVSARTFPSSGADGTVVACQAPNATEQIECYCTTATCGAGMLDAGAALGVAITGLQAVITLGTATPLSGQALQLSGADSAALGGRTITAYQWALVAGGGIVTGFDGATNAVNAVVTPSAAGTFTVSLLVTDDLNRNSTISRNITVQAPPASGGGGGGALGLGWLGLLLAAVLALYKKRRRHEGF